MLIGKIATKGEGEGAKLILEISLPLGVKEETFLVSKVKNPATDKSPDFVIRNKANGICGGLWNESTIDRNGNSLDYMTGVINSPVFANGSLNFACFMTKIDENTGEVPKHSHDVVWSKTRKKADDGLADLGELPEWGNTSGVVNSTEVEEY